METANRNCFNQKEESAEQIPPARGNRGEDGKQSRITGLLNLLVSGAPAPRGQRGRLPPAFVYGGSAGAEKCPFSALVQYRSERLSFSQDGTSLTLAHLEGYCLAPADIQQGHLHQRGSGGLSLLLSGGGREMPCPSFAQYRSKREFFKTACHSFSFI